MRFRASGFFMNKTKLPTFRKWAARLAERKRGLLCLVGIAASLALAHEALRRYFATPLECNQPCRDGLNCEPLSLSVEVKPKRIKVGVPHSLWYRVELKNRSCQRVSVLDAGAFIDSQKLLLKTSGLWVSVTGPDGRELERLPYPRADGGMAWDYGTTKGRKTFGEGTIHPYRMDEYFYQRARRAGRLSDDWYTALDPGESFVTIPSKLGPYRIVATSSTKYGAISHGSAWVDTDDAPSFPSPPADFQSFDRYSFNRPGKYVLRVGFVAKPSFETGHPYWEALSKSAQRWFEMFRLRPKYGIRLNATKVSIETPPHVIEVVR